MKKISITLMTMATQLGFSQTIDSTKTQAPVLMPGMAGPLTANPEPLKLKTGVIGDIYVSGVVSGFYQLQNNVFPGDKKSQSDISNSQVFVQKTDGVIQYFVQFGGYSIPAIGVPYFRSIKAMDAYYGILPQGYLKLTPTKNVSILAGKLPTVIGAEYTFSFENMNIQRGLLWNQENAVNRGMQLNYSTGPLSLAMSCNDGFYSKKYTWIWGSASYAINSNNTIAFIGGGNTRVTAVATTATPLYQNNQQIYNIIYTHNSGPWTIIPYLQHTKVPKSTKIGTTENASTSSAALFVKYGVPNSGFNFPLRFEYIDSKGDATAGAPNLLYGPGSNAWSVTLTPTYQYKRFFGRTEFSYVHANKTTDGSVFGPNGNDKTQARMLFEVGLLF